VSRLGWVSGGIGSWAMLRAAEKAVSVITMPAATACWMRKDLFMNSLYVAGRPIYSIIKYG